MHVIKYNGPAAAKILLHQVGNKLPVAGVGNHVVGQQRSTANNDHLAIAQHLLPDHRRIGLLHGSQFEHQLCCADTTAPYRAHEVRFCLHA